MTRRIELAGQRFGRLLVTDYAGGQKWNCACGCGSTTAVWSIHLRRGATTSCGCHRAAWCRKHGLTGLPEHSIWVAMVDRCYNPKSQNFPRYGARGIEVCERWRASPVNFLEDMGKRPSPDHSIDRINNNGNYEPGNCRWATRVEQQNNFGRNRRLTIGGRTQTVAQWAKEAGLPDHVFRQRAERGWDLERTIKTPVRAWAKGERSCSN